MVALKQVAAAAAESCHSADLESVICDGEFVYSAADDGKVMVWSKDLVLQKEVQAHEYAVYDLLIFKGRLFTASIDMTIKVWKLPSLELEATLTGHEDSIRRLTTNGKRLFSGDERGHILVWSFDTLASQNRYEVVEEVWDLKASGNYFINVRDRGVNVTEIKDANTNAYTVVNCMQGRAPLYLSDKYLVFGQFPDGRGLHLHEHKPTDFPRITDIKGHDQIITCISGCVVGSQERLASGGYDNKVNLWELPSARLLASCDTATVPTTIVATIDGAVYVGGANGYLVKLMTS